MAVAFIFDWADCYLFDPLSQFFQNTVVKFALKLIGRVIPFAWIVVVETLVFHLLAGFSWERSILTALAISAGVYGLYLIVRRIRRPRVLSAIANGGETIVFGFASAVGDLWPSVEPKATYVPKRFRGAFQFVWGFLVDIQRRTCTVYTVVYD
jgi:hypothetical protein